MLALLLLAVFFAALGAAALAHDPVQVGGPSPAIGGELSMELPLISASGDAAEPAQAGPRGAGASTTHPEEGALGGGGSWQPTRLVS